MSPHVSRLIRLCRRIIDRQPVIRQYDRVDCGPACLLSILRFYGGEAGIPKVRALSGTNAEGTSLLGLQRAAIRLGLDARGATGSYDDLRRECLPCIAHVVQERIQHYVVVYEVRERHVKVGDPSRGLHWLSREVFERIWTRRAVLLVQPTDALTVEPPPHWLGWVLGRTRHLQGWLAQSVFLGLVFTGLGLATAVVVQRLIDVYIGAGDAHRILWAGGLLLAIHTAKGAVGYLRQRFLVTLGKKSSTAIASDFLGHLFRLPASYFNTRKRGDVIARIQDASEIQRAALDLVGNTTIDVLVTVFSMLGVFYFSSSLGWIALVLVLPCALFAGLAAQRIHREQGEALSAYGRLHASYVDAVDGMDTIRGLGLGPAFARLNLFLFGRFQDRVERLGFTQARIGVQVETVNGVLLAATLTVGALLVAGGQLEIGAMMAAYSLVAGAVPSLQRVVGGLFTFQAGAAAAQRIQDLLLTEAEEAAGSKPFAMESRLRLDDARFAWPHGAPVLLGAHLELKRGRIVGLTGSNGSGKTTLVRLLSRQYPLSEGRLRVDEVDSASIDLESYRRAVAVVPETAKIFHGTLGENLAMGLGDARHPTGPAPFGSEELAARLHTLGASPFIRRFRDGLLTMLGEDGQHLSAGERQMVGLLRALITRPSVLIVDEGLNALDPRMNRTATRALATFAESGATLLISHHPGVLAMADERLRLHRGVVRPWADPAPGAEAA